MTYYNQEIDKINELENKISELEQQNKELRDLIERIAVANGIDPKKLNILEKYI